MKKIAPIAAACGLVAVSAFVPQGPAGALAVHNAALSKANGVRIVFTVQPIPGVGVEHTLLLGKPGSMLWTSPTKTVASNGKTLWVVDPVKHEYTESPVAEGELAKRLATDATWVWSGFFGGDAFKDASGVQAGGKRNIKGVLVNEVTFTTAAPKSLPVTAYIDAKSGLIRGFSMKSGGAETLVIASVLELSNVSDPSLASFAVPAGAAKVEAAAVTGPAYAEVAPIFQARCLPCHSAQMRQGGLDATTYAGLTRTGRRGTVTPGNAAQSAVIQFMRGQRQPRMPQGGAPVPEAEIAKIAAWIDAGAKE